MSILLRTFMLLVFVCSPWGESPAQIEETIAASQDPQAGKGQSQGESGLPSALRGSLPSGTPLHLRLRETVSSFGSRPEMPVSAIVIQPIRLGAQTVLPLGTEVRGSITRVRRIGLGFGSETAVVGLGFDELRLPGGDWQPLTLRVIRIDNSRETVDATGEIHGIRATSSASKVLSGTAISIASLDPMSLLFGLSASLSAFRIPESEIILPVGAELQAVTEAPLAVTLAFPEPPTIFTSDADREHLLAFTKQLPYRTATANKRGPSDITSILFLADEADILRAFDAAGWSRSDALNAQSSYGAMRSVVENQGYREGPVSTLLLDGKPPIGAWSKTLDTFFARHHLRVFAQSQQFEGKSVFVTSATHDSGIGINKSTKTLIHLIDEEIDEERDKVVDDMLLTGCAAGVEYIDRPWIPADPAALRNATGDTLRTDRRMAVIKLNHCTAPKRSDQPDPELKRVHEKAVAPERVARDGFLYLRDDLYRGNIAYQSYSAGKIAWKFLRQRNQTVTAAQPRVIFAMGEPYTVLSRPRVPFLPQRGQFYDPGTLAPSFHPPGEPPSYKTRLEYSISGGYSRFANRTFSDQPLSDFDSALNEELIGVNFVQALHAGYVIAPRATINSWRYVSNEFGYTYNKAPLTITNIYNQAGMPPDVQYDDGQVRQFTYNTLVHLRPNGSRFRPFIAVGPSFQLLRLYDSQPSKNRLLSITVKDVGVIVDAYNFGHKPPLEGGGIFQFGLQYGGGFKYQLTPKLFLRSDFRETISPQPDYWSKSYAYIRELNAQTAANGSDAQFIIGKQVFGGLLRQRIYTTGIGISF